MNYDDSSKIARSLGLDDDAADTVRVALSRMTGFLDALASEGHDSPLIRKHPICNGLDFCIAHAAQREWKDLTAAPLRRAAT